jgi:hypothetical protein
LCLPTPFVRKKCLGITPPIVQGRVPNSVGTLGARSVGVRPAPTPKNLSQLSNMSNVVVSGWYHDIARERALREIK